MRKSSIIFILSLLSLSIFAQTNTQTNTYFAEVEQWHNIRIAELKQPNGWLNLEGLFWFKKGTNSFGSAATNDLVYNNPTFPKHLGDFIYENGQVFWKDVSTQKIRIKDKLFFKSLNKNNIKLDMICAKNKNYKIILKFFPYLNN